MGRSGVVLEIVIIVIVLIEYGAYISSNYGMAWQ